VERAGSNADDFVRGERSDDHRVEVHKFLVAGADGAVPVAAPRCTGGSWSIRKSNNIQYTYSLHRTRKVAQRSKMQRRMLWNGQYSRRRPR
jgi:hypothetical protein